MPYPGETAFNRLSGREKWEYWAHVEKGQGRNRPSVDRSGPPKVTYPHLTPEQKIKALARGMLRNATRSGRVIRASRCEACGVKEKLPGRVIYAHHTDYSKPLDVQWLCGACHGKAHRKQRGEKQGPITG